MARKLPVFTYAKRAKRLVKDELSRKITNYRNKVKNSITTLDKDHIEIFKKILNDKEIIKLADECGVRLNYTKLFRIKESFFLATRDILEKDEDKRGFYMPYFGTFEFAKKRFIVKEIKGSYFTRGQGKDIESMRKEGFHKIAKEYYKHITSDVDYHEESLGLKREILNIEDHAARE